MMTLLDKRGEKAKSVYEEKMRILLTHSQSNRTVAGIQKKDAIEARKVERIDPD